MRAKTVNEKYSQHDQDLINKAKRTDYIHHYLVDDMVDQAESEEAKETLRSIARSYYHREEGRNI